MFPQEYFMEIVYSKLDIYSRMFWAMFNRHLVFLLQSVKAVHVYSRMQKNVQVIQTNLLMKSDRFAKNNMPVLWCIALVMIVFCQNILVCITEQASTKQSWKKTDWRSSSETTFSLSHTDVCLSIMVGTPLTSLLFILI